MNVAVDTNVLVRLLVADDTTQARRAEALFRENTILIVASVLLETEWVLRSAYEFPPEKIERGFVALLGLPQIVLSDPDAIRHTIAGYRAGLDFADALHLASCRQAERFATFDRKLAKRVSSMPDAKEIMVP